VDEELLPIQYALHPAYPNPFNPITSLRYDLPEQAQVTLTIYDLMGRKVTRLLNTVQDAGFRSVQWNATDMHGKPVSAGVYLYQIQAGEFVQTRKMVLLK
jgi:flagellar hook assembly protein FlgD